MYISVLNWILTLINLWECRLWSSWRFKRPKRIKLQLAKLWSSKFLQSKENLDILMTKLIKNQVVIQRTSVIIKNCKVINSVLVFVRLSLHYIKLYHIKLLTWNQIMSIFNLITIWHNKFYIYIKKKFLINKIFFFFKQFKFFFIPNFTLSYF